MSLSGSFGPVVIVTTAVIRINWDCALRGGPAPLAQIRNSLQARDKRSGVGLEAVMGRRHCGHVTSGGRFGTDQSTANTIGAGCTILKIWQLNGYW